MQNDGLLIFQTCKTSSENAFSLSYNIKLTTFSSIFYADKLYYLTIIWFSEICTIVRIKLQIFDTHRVSTLASILKFSNKIMFNVLFLSPFFSCYIAWIILYYTYIISLSTIFLSNLKYNKPHCAMPVRFNDFWVGRPADLQTKRFLSSEKSI